MKGRRRRIAQHAADAAAEVATSAQASASTLAPYTPQVWTGEKYAGGLNQLEAALWTTTDYWTLRKMSQRLFRTNLYARGLIRRLVTNEINTGLHLEATPVTKLLGLTDDDALADWSEDVETLFELWGADPWLCDVTEMRTFGALQQTVRMQALVDGDILVALRQSKVTGLPRLQLISGSQVQTPLGATPRKGNRICHGVELDSAGRQVAYWVTQEDGTSVRLPAAGEKSGRKLAWLVYGTDRRHDDVRGEPLLALVLQALKEVDRFRDATLRKAVLNSILAMFVKKTAERPGTMPLTGGAVRRGTDTTVDASGQRRTFAMAEWLPGMMIDELQVGEEPVPFPQSAATEGFGDFEEAIIQTVAWANEIPPEILRLTFSSNYSASKAANNEFDMYVTKVRTQFGAEFCAPVYVEWLVAACFAKLVVAAGLIEAWRDSKRFVEFGAWSASDWAGQIKPSIDLSKVVQAYDGLLRMGGVTRDRMSRELSGMKFARVVKQLKRENEQLFEANKLLAELEQDAFVASEDPDLAEQPQQPEPKTSRASRRARRPGVQLSLATSLAT